MGRFLNSIVPYEAYNRIAHSRYFVDKTALLSELISALDLGDRYFCITRPRRFGKSVMAHMIAAFFEKDMDSSTIFEGLGITKKDADFSFNFDHKDHMNQHPVIFIDLSTVPEQCMSYQDYILYITTGLKNDLSEAYPELSIDPMHSLWDILTDIYQKTGDRFLFVMDEWDAMFHMSFSQKKDKDAYLLFLKMLLKDRVYVEFAYMTGVLPIAKYSSGSELNMFTEYDMTITERFSQYFGFLDKEVDRLYEIYRNTQKNPKVTREDLRTWYDGYCTAAGGRLYNPRSVVNALVNNQIRNYWTSSGPYDEIFYYIRHNVDEIQDDLALMITGAGIETRIQEYAAVSQELNTKVEIYSAMVIYGLLTYEEASGCVSIPNRELMHQFDQMLLSHDNLGYVHRLAKISTKMLKSTLDGDTKTMAEILQYAHDTESPILSYNSEIELSAVVNLVYLAARDKYRVEREDRAGKGYVDFIFYYPEKKNADAIILELKVDHTPEEAIAQIKDKNYILRFQGKLGKDPKYTGRILAVGIGYSRTTKAHSCRIEVLQPLKIYKRI